MQQENFDEELIVGSFVSLDGVIEAPMSWASPFFVGDALDHSYQKAGEAEYFLLGRVTYELFSSRWPQVQGRYMDRMNGMKKLVASRTLKEVGWNAPLIEGDVAEGSWGRAAIMPAGQSGDCEPC